MKPWTIIGWIILSCIAVFIGFLLLALFAVLKNWIGRRVLYYKTRNIPPAEGQRWVQDDAILEIGKTYPKGHFGIKSGNASWGELPEDWKQRVRSRKLFLLK